MPPMTTLNAEVTLLKATKIVPMMPLDLPRIHQAIGTIDTAIADGAAVTATRIDQVGSAAGTTLTDDRGNVFAIFGAAIAAGRWSLQV